MPAEGRYYIGRIIKTGALTNQKIIKAIKEPVIVQSRKYAWTFTNPKIFESENKPNFVYAKLTKYAPEGSINIVDINSHSEIIQPEPNLTKASSPFIYIPKYSGIVFLHIWIDVEYKTFIKIFSNLIIEKYQGFFVACNIELVSDLRKFYEKLSILESIEKLSAKVNPPNPLFGPLWEDLKKYLAKRNASQLKIDENCSEGQVLNSQLKDHIKGVLEQTPNKPYEPDKVDIGDSAILMAIDGYGKGKIQGKQNNNKVVIRTTDTVKHFSYDKDPTPETLYEKALSIFEKINTERHMKHD